MSMMSMDITHVVLPYFHVDGKSGKGMKWGKSGKSSKVSKSSGGKSAKPVNIIHMVTVPHPNEAASWSGGYDDDDEDSWDGGYRKPIDVMTNRGKAGKKGNKWEEVLLPEQSTYRSALSLEIFCPGDKQRPFFA
ncbi:hypothetical protein ACHAXS_006558 [Conticribra weissflogii]